MSDPKERTQEELEERFNQPDEDIVFEEESKKV